MRLPVEEKLWKLFGKGVWKEKKVRPWTQRLGGWGVVGACAVWRRREGQGLGLP